MNVIGKVYEAGQATVRLSFKPTINKMEFFVDTHTHIYTPAARLLNFAEC